jgi:hypothetical protein
MSLFFFIFVGKYYIPSLTMNKFFFILLLTAIFSSCSEDNVSNTPSIQGQVNGNIFFRTTNTSASIADNGALTITGEDAGQEVNLKTEALQRGSFILGGGNANEATFRTRDSTLYSTGTVGSGEIFIDRIEDGMISGRAYFYARVNGQGDTLNFAQGAFFEIPVDSTSNPVTDLTCEEATSERMTAEEAFTQANADDGNFSDLCNAYKSALQAEIDICGDDADLQILIDGLPCNTEINCEDAGAAASVAENAYNQANPDNVQQFQIVCQSYKEALQIKIGACGDENGDIQAIIDGLDCGS